MEQIIKSAQEIQKNDDIKYIQFLLLGSSYGHISPVLNHFPTDKLIIFTSKHLEQETKKRVNEIEIKYKTESEIVLLEPFESDALFNMTKIILEKANEFHKNNKDLQPVIISGVTGGTNLMAISMALASLIMGWTCHYVVKGDGGEKIELKIDNQIISIDILKHLNKSYKLKKMEQYFLKKRE